MDEQSKNLRIYEQFVLSSQEEALNKLVKGSDEHRYFTTLKLLQSQQYTPELAEQIAQYVSFNSSFSNDIKLRALFSEYDSLKENDQKRIAILKQIALTFNVDYDEEMNQPSQEQNEQEIQNVQSNLPIQFEIEQFLQDRNNLKDIKKIKSNIISILDIEQIGQPSGIVRYMAKMKHSLAGISNVTQLFQKLIKIDTEFNQQHFAYLSIQQMEELNDKFQTLQEDEYFVHSLMRKRYENKLINHNSNLQTIALYYKILDNSNQFKKKFRNQYYYIILFKLIQLINNMIEEIQQNDYDKIITLLNEHWVQFEQIQTYDFQSIFRKYFEEINLIKFKQEVHEFIKKYIKQGFDPKDKFKEVLIEEQQLKQLDTIVKLQQGMQIDGLYDIFNSKQLEEMNSEKKIIILQQNKQKFALNEPIQLIIEFKNIQQLQIQIFEVNTLNYYLEHYQQFNQDLVNLDGLIPTYEEQFTYNQQSIEVFTKQFEFQQIKKRGIYIIQFNGNGISSKAIIFLGQLQLKEQLTIAGHSFQIVNEHFELCSSEDTYMIVNNKKFNVNLSRKEILIPYGDHGLQTDAIIVHEGFASLRQITIIQEDYKLQNHCIYDQSQFMYGMNSTIILNPSLIMNNQQLSMKLLEQPQLSIIQLNENDEETETKFTDITHYPFQVTFKVINNCRRILLNFSGHITKLNQKKLSLTKITEILYASESFNSALSGQFLRLTQDGYEIQILTKEGIGCPNRILQLKFTHKNLKEGFTKKIESNGEGIIKLGKLDDIAQIESKEVGNEYREAYEDMSDKCWKLKRKSDKQLNRQIIFIEDQYTYNGSVEKATLLRMIDDFFVEMDCSELIEKYQDNSIKIQFKESGNYILILRENNEEFQQQIQVIKGTLNKQFNMIQDGYHLIQHVRTNNFINIKNIEQKYNDQGLLTLSGQLEGNLTKSLLVLKAKQFLNEEETINGLNKQFKYDKFKQIEIEQPSNIYLSNKRLSDEELYVQERSKQTIRYLGNTLEKPQILLQRNFIRDTNATDESMSEGSSYINSSPNKECLFKERLFNAKQKVEIFNAPAGSIVVDRVNAAEGMKCAKPGQKKMKKKKKIKKYSDEDNQFEIELQFLKHNTYQAIIEIDENGKFKIDLPAQYSILILEAYNQYSQQIKYVPLQNHKLQLRNVVHKSKLNNEKFYSRTFNSYVLDQQDQYKENLQEQVTRRVIQTREELYESIKELFIHSTFQDNTSLDEWRFIFNWNTLSLEEKHKLYNEYQSDELNLFIYCQDYTYFDIYIQSYISNKMEKSFMDKYLLFQMDEYSNLQKYNELNQLEKALAIIYFNEVLENKQLAYAMLQNIKDNSSPRDIRKYNLMMSKILGLSGEQYYEPEESEDDGEGGGGGGEGEGTYQYRNCQKEWEKKRFYSENDDEEAYDDEDDDYYLQRRTQMKQAYKYNAKTIEYGERHYYYMLSMKDQAIPNHQFWIDLAEHSLQKGLMKTPFISPNYIDNCANIPSIVIMSGLMNLPQSQSDKLGKSPKIVFEQLMQESKPQIDTELIIQQKIRNAQGKLIQINDNQVELQVNKIYKLLTIFINCNDQLTSFLCISEIPEGAITQENEPYCTAKFVRLREQHNEQVDFYFPHEGIFNMYPATASKNGVVIQRANKIQFKVVKTKASIDENNWNDVVATGDKKLILKYLGTHQLELNQLVRFSTMLKDKDFYYQVTQLFRQKGCFEFQVLKYSLYYQDQQGLVEFFQLPQMQSDLKKKFKYFKCSLFEISNIQYLEYYPLIQNRVHKFNSESNKILNVEFQEQYREFLKYLVEKPTHSTQDRLTLVYYLLLQERVKEGIKVFSEIQDKSNYQLQMDYFTAYLDFYIDYPNFIQARQICEKYLNYPILQWRNLFYEIANLLAQYDGDDDMEKIQQIDEGNNTKRQEIQAEENLESELQGQSFSIIYRNLENITIQYFKLDLELLFSKNPFISNLSKSSLLIKPQQQEQHNLKQENFNGINYQEIIQLPQDLIKSNLLIQIKGNNKSSTLRYYPNQLQVIIMEKNGQLRVTDLQGKYLSKIYVKTYIKKKNNEILFYKDGYTDLRGRFDYASLSASVLGDISKFAIFISSDELGCVLKEVDPPDQIGRIFEEVKLVSKIWSQKAEMQSKCQINDYDQRKSKMRTK